MNVDVLKIIKKELERRNRTGAYIGGLCSIVDTVKLRGDITEVDDYSFKQLLKDHIKNTGQKIFFTWSGITTDCPSKFLWRMGEFKPRKIWLDNEIKKLEQ